MATVFEFLKVTEDVKSASDARHRVEMITLILQSHWRPCRGRSWVRELECLNEGNPPSSPRLPPEKAQGGDWEFHQGNTFGVKSTFPPSPKHWHHPEVDFYQWYFTYHHFWQFLNLEINVKNLFFLWQVSLPLQNVCKTDLKGWWGILKFFDVLETFTGILALTWQRWKHF